MLLSHNSGSIKSLVPKRLSHIELNQLSDITSSTSETESNFKRRENRELRLIEEKRKINQKLVKAVHDQKKMHNYPNVSLTHTLKTQCRYWGTD